MIRAAAKPSLVLMVPVAAATFLFSWFFRFNDPGGSFAGLTDDHFFYLVRGWQILFGDLPVRDFVDHGAPLFYYVGAAVQVLMGRGTLPELTFAVTAIAAGAALTFLLAARASGSIAAGLVGAFFQVVLEPRFYNYPKILVYAVAIPALWWFADRPAPRTRAAAAVATAVGFLFRHDHGVFVAVAMAALLLLMTGVPWRDRLRHAVAYGVLVVVLLTPYLLFIQMNGGVVSYFRQASAWAERDRDRAPVVWPGLFDNPDGVSDAARTGTGITRPVAVVRDNLVAWIYYLEIVLPFFALFVLAISVDACRPRWPNARAKIGMVAVLAVVLDAGFLRSPLAARLADPSVPLAILIAWLAVAVPRLVVGRSCWRPSLLSRLPALRGVLLGAGAPIAFLLALEMSHDFGRRLEKAALDGGLDTALERVDSVSRQVRTDWDLATWIGRPDRPELIDLSMYVNACTNPSDRVLVQAYLPQVLALARRAFAGGHADLRPGFFNTDDAQQLTIERLKRQTVPIVLLDTGTSYENFRKSFPLVTAYVDDRYRLAGTHVFDDRFGISLFVRRDLVSHSVYEPLGWPCYGTGQVASS